MLLFFLFNSVGVKAQHTNTLHRHESMHRHTDTHIHRLSLFFSMWRKFAPTLKKGSPKVWLISAASLVALCPGPCRQWNHSQEHVTTPLINGLYIQQAFTSSKDCQGHLLVAKSTKVVNRLTRLSTNCPSH